MNGSQENNSVTTVESAIDAWKCDWDMTKISLILSYFLIFMIGTCGNILVLTLFRRKVHHSTLNLLILYLAAFDLFASIFVPFLFGYWVWTCDLEWHFGWFGCKILPVASRIFTSVSIGILLIMAIERCRVIVSPFKPPLSRLTIHLSVFGTIFLAFVSETHYIMILHITESGQCALTIPDFYIYTSISVTLFRTIVFITIFVSTTLLVTCKLRGKTGLDNGESQEFSSHVEMRLRRKRRAMKMLVVMMIVFGVTVLPRDLFRMSLVTSYLLPERFWIEYS
jgi:7 transmembrane receptor (rhodopsin family).